MAIMLMVDYIANKLHGPHNTICEDEGARKFSMKTAAGSRFIKQVVMIFSGKRSTGHPKTPKTAKI